MRETKKYPENHTPGWRHEIMLCYLTTLLTSAKNSENSRKMDFYHTKTKREVLLTYLSSHDRNHHSRTLSFSSINNSFIAHWENIHWHNIWKEKKSDLVSIPIMTHNEIQKSKNLATRILQLCQVCVVRNPSRSVTCPKLDNPCFLNITCWKFWTILILDRKSVRKWDRPKCLSSLSFSFLYWGISSWDNAWDTKRLDRIHVIFSSVYR